MDDHVEPGVEAVLDGGVGDGVRGGQPLVTMGLVDDRSQLVRREGRQVRVRGPRAAARRHDLDEVGALLDELADRAPDTVGAVGLAAEVVEVAAGDRHRPARDDHARPSAMPRLIASRTEKAIRPIEPFSRIVVTPEWSIARALTVALMQQQVVALGGDVVAARPVADADEVRMPVDEPGQDRRVAVLVRGRLRAVGRPDLRTTADGPDRPALDQDGRVLERAGARPIEQAGGGEERPVGWRGHVRTSVAISARVVHPMIELLDRHVVYENPKPMLRSRHGYFPGIVELPSGELLALLVIGEAFEAVDLATHVARSADGGRSWTLQGPLIDKTARRAPDQRLPQAAGPARRLAHRARLSVPSRRSRAADRDRRDRRRAARRRRRLVLDRRGPDVDASAVIPRSTPELLEIPSRPAQLRSGDIVATAGLFKMPDGTNPSGQFGPLLRSTDGGRTWDDRTRYFDSPDHSIAAYESHVCEMQPGRARRHLLGVRPRGRPIPAQPGHGLA